MDPSSEFSLPSQRDPVYVRFRGAFPPVKPDPTVDDAIRAARISDYFLIAGVTAGSWGFGFVRGRPARFVMAGLMSGIGFTFGTLIVLQNTRGRLMGLRENATEVKKYGAVEIAEDKPRNFWDYD